MKTYYSFIIFMAIALSGRAQLPLNGKHYADSIRLALNNTVSDSAKARSYFLLSDYFIRTADTLKSRQNLQQGMKYAGGNKYLRSVSLVYRAGAMPAHDADSAAKMFLQADKELQSFKTIDAFSARAKCWHDYARMLQFTSDDLEGYVNMLLNKAAPLAKQAGDWAYLGKIYLDVAFAFKNLTDFKKADEYLILAIKILRNAPGSSSYLASAYHTISENYSLSGKSKQAAAMLDSMRVLLQPYPDSDAWLDYYAGEGMRLTIAEQYEQSLAVIGKGIALAQKLGQAYPEQRLLMQKFYALYNKKDFKQAKDVALDLTHRYPYMTQAANRSQLFYCLALTSEDLKDKAGAYDWMKRYAALNDSLSRSTLQAKINALDIKYQTAEKQKKITKLEADRQKAVLTNWLLGIASITLLIITAFLIYYYRNSKKLAQQKELNHQQQLKEIEQQQQLKFTQAMLTGEEQERQRVARDLHDGLGGMLSGIKIKLSGQAKAGGHQELDGVIQQLDHSVTELRRIARNMMPESLLRLGLETALRDLCESLMSEQTQIKFQAYDIRKDMPAVIQANIYRIVQELLSNSVRHAQASKIILQCSQNAEIFLITIEDNGIGFDTTAGLNAEGIGFSNIKNRVDYMKGKMDIESVINEGTTINIELNAAG
ncbi:Histidine kinase-, DNA gyrase B-, and HSP90-like ATPase [Mucilaginibacter sp. OK268]|uniref:sensor histidine kinase n=1 Tax=Mucilaginibacter sp. OK268 TaxID=1881048 RepID=UPI0008845B2A|nr:sensor histidine kinase [Mucilaginibacter sp. OK268]SDQ01543.1 Histidine kinase-, DNA gyrase B-, and HSP90-like ATPase [Mucilaginibacter sp. OK268]